MMFTKIYKSSHDREYSTAHSSEFNRNLIISLNQESIESKCLWNSLVGFTGSEKESDSKLNKGFFEHMKEKNHKEKWLARHNSSFAKLKNTTNSKATNRIAVIDLEWSFIKAVDIFTLFSSFLPKHSRLLSVIILQSEYGLARIKEEKIKGPNFVYNKRGRYDSLSQYERLKKRWFYAIAEFDNDLTAREIYSSCNGHEFELTASILDLRYVSGHVNFDKQLIRDRATEIPPLYLVPTFCKKSNTGSSWDQKNLELGRVLNGNQNRKEINTANLNNFLQSGGEEEPVENILAIRERFRGLIHRDLDDFEKSKKKSKLTGKITSYCACTADELQKATHKAKISETLENTQALLTNERKNSKTSQKLKKNLRTYSSDIIVKTKESDLEDDRFDKLFTSHDFALDPSNQRIDHSTNKKSLIQKAIKTQKSLKKMCTLSNNNESYVKLEKSHWSEVRLAVKKLKEKTFRNRDF